MTMITPSYLGETIEYSSLDPVCWNSYERQVALFGEMCAEPLFVYFSKYIQICIRS